MITRGSFTISLDFELFWGVRTNRTIDNYKDNLLGVYEVTPKILSLFEKYGIHATWATVGFLFFNTIEEIKENIPSVMPNYDNKSINPYNYLQNISKDDCTREFNQMHLASILIDSIQKTPYQEIATHTFSHFFTQEPHSNQEAFTVDMEKAISTAKKKGFLLNSLVFPRNQISKNSIDTLKSSSLKSYRGNPIHWAYCDGDSKKPLYIRIYRLFDTYLNLSGNHISNPILSKNLVELKASMILRAYNHKLYHIESLKVRRIKRAMSKAAKEGKNFHLWWHPHNFGVDQKENLKNLEKILSHFKELQKNRGMLSLNMEELANGGEYVN